MFITKSSVLSMQKRSFLPTIKVLRIVEATCFSIFFLISWSEFSRYYLPEPTSLPRLRLPYELDPTST